MMISTRQHVINWVSQTWESISTETITKSLVCGISNIVDGFKDYLIREEIPRDLEDRDDEANQEGPSEKDSDVDDLEPFSDSDD